MLVWYESGYLVLMIAAIVLLIVLFRRREQVTPNSFEETLSTIGLSICLGLIGFGTVYIVLHLLTYFIPPR